MAVPNPPDRESDKERESKVILRDDPKFTAGKIVAFQYVIVGVIGYLAVGYFNLQVKDHDYYASLAERNYIRSYPIPAPRGKILDRDGRVMVDNHSSYSLLLSRETLRDEHLPAICKGLELPCADVADKLRRMDQTSPRYVPVRVKDGLTRSQLTFVEAHRNPESFPEMEIIQNHQRLYPAGGIAAHVLGYTGEISESQLSTTEFARYKVGDIVGKAGIERQYNDLLMGVDGQRRVIVDNRNREREVIEKKEAIAGRNLRLSIDLDLQAVAELAMEDRRGGVVALDPRTGEVLALVSRPNFDPSMFADRLTQEEWESIRDDPDHPLINRAIQSPREPGSTFKPIVSWAALESGIIDDHSPLHCSGGATFYDRRFACNSRGGHGSISLPRALARSCNVFYYQLGHRLGIERLANYASIAGLGRRTGIDLPGEHEGTVPSRRWKIRIFRQRWLVGETINTSIGQGYLAVTPLQLAHAIGGLAIGGTWHQPHIVVDPPQTLPAPRVHKIDPAHVAPILKGMSMVVNGGGTATVAHIPGIELCGKTGTAQVASKTLAKSRRGSQELVDNAWFVGFAPRSDPEIVVAALYESGEHGDRAAPIVRDVVKAYFDKKKRAARPVLSASGRRPEEVR